MVTLQNIYFLNKLKRENKNIKVMSLITNKSLINQHKKTFKEWGEIELLDYIDDLRFSSEDNLPEIDRYFPDSSSVISNEISSS